MVVSSERDLGENVAEEASWTLDSKPCVAIGVDTRKCVWSADVVASCSSATKLSDSGGKNAKGSDDGSGLGENGMRASASVSPS